MDLSSTCERVDDLVSVLYGEASERERRDFELHMNQCGNCRAEFAAFAQVRESVGEWRDEVLSGFVPANAAAPVRKSAFAALRQFFDLSPLWLKGAVGFAAVVFCVLGAFAFLRLTDKPVQVATGNPDAVYTKQDLDRAVQEALAKQQREQPVVEPKSTIVVQSPAPRSANVAKAEPKARRPFSKAEREQLAAELRLLSSDDEADLDLLDDRRDR
ncbi:MAG TPA: zf-HC2 domain-containing protein [Pyrinomonadaceae bacterium]|nr:zf-HC2 domain-containing protein [Pyrinomonadaceae bacterium]